MNHEFKTMPKPVSLETLSKALADQTRLRMLMLLATAGELCVCELTEVLQLAQPKISRHLAILRESGLLQDRKAGLWVYYQVNPDLPDWAQTMIKALVQGGCMETCYQADAQRLAQLERQAGLCA